MARDFDIARKIVANLQTLQESEDLLRNPCKISLNHDDQIETERLKDTDTEIRVSPEELTHTRVARSTWQDGHGIRVKMFAKAADHLDTALLEQWCNFVDQITNHLKAAKFDGKRCSSISLRFNQRYDRAALKDTKVYSTTLLVTYPLI